MKLRVTRSGAYTSTKVGEVFVVVATQVPIEAQRIREALADAQRVSREHRPRAAGRAR